VRYSNDPAEMSRWVIHDRTSRLCLPVDVRLSPKATQLLRGSENTRWANNGILGAEIS
jgi:hypothetical protein